MKSRVMGKLCKNFYNTFKGIFIKILHCSWQSLHWKWSCSMTGNNGGFTFRNTANIRHTRQKKWWKPHITDETIRQMLFRTGNIKLKSALTFAKRSHGSLPSVCEWATWIHGPKKAGLCFKCSRHYLHAENPTQSRMCNLQKQSSQKYCILW